MQKAAPKGAAFCYGHTKGKTYISYFSLYTSYLPGFLKIDSSTLALTVTLVVTKVNAPI